MTSEEIRALPILGLDIKVDGKSVDDVQTCLMIERNALLREIAWQLAVANEREAARIPRPESSHAQES
jgi:hypothetical protein